MLAALAAGAVALPASAETKCSVGQMLQLPVTMSGLRPMVPARINGHDVKFIVDSGAFYSNISPGSAAELGLKLSDAPGNMRVIGIGGETRISIARVKDFGLGEANLHNIEFMVGGGEMGGTGLLGQNVLGIGDVEYDLAGGAIRLMKSKNCSNVNLAYWAAEKKLAVSVIEIETPTPVAPHTAGTVMLNGVKIRAIFDTGAATTMITKGAAARAGIKPDSPGVEPAGESGGIGRRTYASWIGPFQSLKIGDEEIRKIRLRFADINQTDFDMLIGADFFLSHRVYVSNAQRRIFFTYNGGPVFDLSVKRAEAMAAAGEKDASAPGKGETGAPGPVTAQDFGQRGNARAARNDNKGALADMNRAVELAPDNPEYRFQRGLAVLISGRPGDAKADLDRALTLKPNYPEALLLRASARIRTGDKAGSRADLAALDHVLPDASDMRLTIGGYYQDLDDPEAAIPQYDRWIAAHPADNRMPMALNGRCWTRALAGKDLDKAIGDCDRALRLRPKTAWSLYGRGVVEHRKGMTAQARTDIDAAIALQKDLPEKAKKIGLDVPE
jgi:predicted aspartyl protease/tetratricopeptide (TPR) repeat protein